MKFLKLISVLTIFSFICLNDTGCNFVTHKTISHNRQSDSLDSEPEPNYNASLDFDYQDFVSYLYIGNRVENFTGYFNTFYKANEDYNDAFDEYRTSLISFYNRRLDSLGITLPVSAGVKEKFDKAIERASKIIQFHKNSKFIDESVLIIGKSYFLLADYYKAERTFNEFLSKFSSSELADEAYLYLGRTKVKLGKMDEGEAIFKSLVKNSSDNEIQSLAARDLGILEYNKGKPLIAANYFNAAIDFSKDKEKKAEGQFIQAKILSVYKPDQAAKEYNKVLDYTSDYDLTFFARLNYAKGLIYNKNFKAADEELESLRKKYRDDAAYTPLVDLEIANNYYAQKNYPAALEKYYEVIVKYPSSPVSSDAYYYLAKHEEEINHNYLNALVNYRKATEENSASDYFKESSTKAATLDRYFVLQGEVNDSAINIPLSNPDVERYRAFYNEEKGINQPPNEGNKDGTNPKGDQEGNPKGEGKPGGSKNGFFKSHRDSTEEQQQVSPESNPVLPNSNPDNTGETNRQEIINKREKEKANRENLNKEEGNKEENTKENGEIENTASDSVKAVNDSLGLVNKEEAIFKAYYELAEIFIYSLDQSDSAEYYLQLLLSKFPDSERQSKVLYTLGNYYKNEGKKELADETFNKIISRYPNTVYANESRKILGVKIQEEGMTESPVNEIFKDALNSFNDKRYGDAISKLKEVESKFPKDSLVAKSLYSIGWIYENELANKDSSLFYFKKLKEKFPDSEYTLKINPMLEYVASMENHDSTKAVNENSSVSDSTKNAVNEGENKSEEVVGTEKKEVIKTEVPPDTTNVNKENQLSQEEIDKLLKESDESGK